MPSDAYTADMAVVDLQQWVSENKSGTPNLECPCGSQWFVVDAVVMDANLSIGGFAGVPRCHDCGKQI